MLLALGLLFWNQGTWVADELISLIGICLVCLLEQVRHLRMVILEILWIQILLAVVILTITLDDCSMHVKNY